MTGCIMREQKSDKQQDYADPELLQKAVHQLLEQISKRDQKIAWINAEKTAALRAFVEKEQALLDKIAERDAVLFYTQAQLTERESQINKIVTSRSWKIALLIQRIHIFLIPPQSRRAQVLERAMNIIFFPFKRTKKN